MSEQNNNNAPTLAEVLLSIAINLLLFGICVGVIAIIVQAAWNKCLIPSAPSLLPVSYAQSYVMTFALCLPTFVIGWVFGGDVDYGDE